ncbi:hypothetical protein BDZ97DRAFT_1941811, partial [Flammula alnicola]
MADTLNLQHLCVVIKNLFNAVVLCKRLDYVHCSRRGRQTPAPSIQSLCILNAFRYHKHLPKAKARDFPSRIPFLTELNWQSLS